MSTNLVMEEVGCVYSRIDAKNSPFISFYGGNEEYKPKKCMIQNHSRVDQKFAKNSVDETRLLLTLLPHQAIVSSHRQQRADKRSKMNF